jgi:hypothetical protein
MRRRNNADTPMSRATINILSSLNWHIQYKEKMDSQDCSHLFLDVTIYFAAFKTAITEVRRKAIAGQYQDKGQFMFDIETQWPMATRIIQGDKLLRHFGHHQIRGLMQAYGTMTVAPLAESATPEMTDQSDIHNEIVVLAHALMSLQRRLMECC